MPTVSWLFMLTSKTLRPFPGSSGSQIEQMPVNSPVAAMAGINIHERPSAAPLAAAISRSKDRPMATASGASAAAKNMNR